MGIETKWTEGPWEINGIAIEAGFEVIAYLREPAHFQGDIRPGHKDEAANAHLIKTAPKLYEALVKLVDRVEQMQYDHNTRDGDMVLDDVRSILAEARGEL